MEILDFETSVRASHDDVRARQIARISSGEELKSILQVGVLRRKIVHMPKRKPIDLDDSTSLNIIFWAC